MNYLTRFLLYGNEGIISKGEKSGSYPCCKTSNDKYNLKSDYHIKRQIVLNKIDKIAIILSYSGDNTQKKHIEKICYILKDFFDKKFLNYSEGPVPLYLKMFHPSYDNLFFIGMFQPLGCIWPGSEQQSKLVAKALKGGWKRPSNIDKLYL